MKRILLNIITFLICNNTFLFAQNLIPNPSFEEYSCLGSINDGCVNNWYAPSSTPDYMNAYSTSYPVPSNNWGYQYPHSGEAYIFIGNFLANYCDDREYISCKLKESLKTNYKYCLSFYISVPDNIQCFYDDVGAYFSVDSIYLNPLNECNHLYLNTPLQSPSGIIISDTANWVKYSFTFTAQGGEQYITIGSFRQPDSIHFTCDLDVIVVGFFIDDVSLYECETPLLPANAGENKTICIGDSVLLGTDNLHNYRYRWHPATGLSDTTISKPLAKPQQTTTYYLYQWDYTDELTVDSVTITVKNCDTISPVNELIIYPNPCKDNLYLEYSYYVPENTKVNITNIIGQTLIKQDFPITEKKKQINISSLAAGVYFCNVYNNKELIRVEKIIIFTH